MSHIGNQGFKRGDIQCPFNANMRIFNDTLPNSIMAFCTYVDTIALWRGLPGRPKDPKTPRPIGPLISPLSVARAGFNRGPAPGNRQPTATARADRAQVGNGCCESAASSRSQVVACSMQSDNQRSHICCYTTALCMHTRNLQGAPVTVLAQRAAHRTAAVSACLPSNTRRSASRWWRT